MNDKPKAEPERAIWERAVIQAVKETRPLPEIVADNNAIHRALRESRMRHTVRVKSKLP